MASSGGTSTPPPPAAAARKEISILFVCLGNICRSPMAHAVFQTHIQSYSSPSFVVRTVDSAGTGAYHARAPPDSRTLQVLEKHGIKGFNHSARKVSVPLDFEQFDLLVGMDQENVEDLIDMRDRAATSRLRSQKGQKSRHRADEQGEAAGDGDDDAEETQNAKGKVVLFGAFGGIARKNAKADATDLAVGEEVIDPYYGGQRGFDVAYEQMDRFTKGLLDWLEQQYAMTEDLLTKQS